MSVGSKATRTGTGSHPWGAGRDADSTDLSDWTADLVTFHWEILQEGTTMHLGSVQEVRTSDEKAFRLQLDAMDFDQPDGTLCAVFGDVLEDINKGGIGYRRLAACIQAGAVLGASPV